MHELMFQAGVKGMSERSELIPCNIAIITVICKYTKKPSKDSFSTAANI